MIKNVARKIIPGSIWVGMSRIKSILTGNKGIYFSQSGEDIILYHYLINCMKYNKISYIDIGANHPVYGNNTYIFYKRRCTKKGILVEPNKELCSLIKKKRSEDICVNAGVGIKEGVAKYYVIDEPGGQYNTISSKEVALYKSQGHKVIRTDKINLIPINKILKDNLKGEKLNLLSIDIEGMDFQIIKSLDFSQYLPDCICTETTEWGGAGEKEYYQDMTQFLEEKGYVVYAKTEINTIYVLKNHPKLD